MESTNIITLKEIRQVVWDLKRRSLRAGKLDRVSTFTNLIIFRLSCCCGLTRQEISRLNLGDVLCRGHVPVIRVVKNVKRLSPLYWDSPTCEDIELWYSHRKKTAKGHDAPFIVPSRRGKSENRLSPETVAKRWRSSIHILGRERIEQLPIKCGRSSFIVHSQRAGKAEEEIVAATNIKWQTLHQLSKFVPLAESRDMFGV